MCTSDGNDVVDCGENSGVLFEQHPYWRALCSILLDLRIICIILLFWFFLKEKPRE